MGVRGTGEEPDATVCVRRDECQPRMDGEVRSVDVTLASPGSGQIMAGKGEEREVRADCLSPGDW